MSVLHLLQTILEFAIIVFIVWGFFNEDKFISFERRIVSFFRRKKLKVVGNGLIRSANSECGIRNS